ncbi:MAG: hypothetical protein PUG48_06475 [Clostridia bacterium]|nr:hypothetical protein [Clostridia bacterium]
MSEHKHSSRLRAFVYSFLSFMLTLVLFLFSISIVVECTVFSKEYMINVMSSNGYYLMVEDELISSMKSLGNASGLKEEFSEKFVKSLDVQSNINDYISAFYSGDSTLVKTTSFKQQLYDALDKYIAENNIDKKTVSNENLDYFVDNATEVYVTEISIPFFSAIANYIYKAQTPFLMITIGLGVTALILIAIIFFTNKFKHRKCRYISYGFIGAFITVAIIPAVIQISDKISKINLNTRSLYNLFVNYTNGLVNGLWICSLAFLLISVVTFVLYIKYYKRATSHNH